MKHIVWLCCIFLAFIGCKAVYSQKKRLLAGNNPMWISISAIGGYGMSTLFNQNIKNAKDIEKAGWTPAISYGGKFGFSLTQYLELGLEICSCNFGQKYNTYQYKKETGIEKEIRAINYLATCKYMLIYGLFAEAGVGVAYTQSAYESNSLSDNKIDQTDNFEKSFVNYALGLGFIPFGTDRIDLETCVRVNYSFANILPGKPFYLSLYKPAFTGETKTTPLTAQLMLRVKFVLAYRGTSMCDRGQLKLFR